MALLVWLPRGHDPCLALGCAFGGWVVIWGVLLCPVCSAVLILSPP